MDANRPTTAVATDQLTTDEPKTNRSYIWFTIYSPCFIYDINITSLVFDIILWLHVWLTMRRLLRVWWRVWSLSIMTMCMILMAILGWAPKTSGFILSGLYKWERPSTDSLFVHVQNRQDFELRLSTLQTNKNYENLEFSEMYWTDR